MAVRSKLCTLILFICWLTPSLGISQTSDNIVIKSLKFINEYDIPFNLKFMETTVGGLSGIDYDRKNDIYYLISDDRSAINPARFYAAKIKISANGIDTLQFSDMKFLLQQNGETFPSAKQDLSHTLDPEAIRFNPQVNQIIWTSEGERATKANPPALVNPSINVSDLTGKLVGVFPTPANLTMQSAEIGPHQNGALEGIALDPDVRMMYVAMEEPLYEDGPKADVVPTKSWTRIYEYNLDSKKNLAQYAYPLEPVAHPANPPTAFKINGISEILSLGNKRLLTIERSFSTGNLACTIKIFLADLRDATHVEQIQSMKEVPPKHPVSKKLLLNMDDLGIFIDNIEGVTFGPDLPNGHKTLLFVSDNNFIPFEKMQLLLFEVIP
jgi:hypothetical protein